MIRAQVMRPDYLGAAQVSAVINPFIANYVAIGIMYENELWPSLLFEPVVEFGAPHTPITHQ
jgi:hypothetical protein